MNEIAFTSDHFEFILLVSTIFWLTQQAFFGLSHIFEWGINWLKRLAGRSNKNGKAV